MPRVILYPYNIASQSARELKNFFVERGIRCLRVKEDGGYRPMRRDIIINWGNSEGPSWLPLVNRNQSNPNFIFLNKCQLVRQACNKLSTFIVLRAAGVSTPEFTTEVVVAQRWRDEGSGVVGRRVLTGHSGEGIETWGLVSEDSPVDAPACRLYTKYVKKAAEYRVHVFNGEVIDVQQKRKRSDFEGEINTKIRSHANGWNFCRENVNPAPAVTEQAIAAVRALGLEFGAVDVIWNNKYQKAYVLEVNTAPGLEGMTVESYGNAILRAF